MSNTISEYLEELVSQKSALAANLTTMGVSASSSEKLNTLVPKVLEIESGGAVVQPLSVTQNGTFNPPSGVDGYAPVTVNVPSSGGGSAVRITTKSTGGMDASVDVYKDEVFVETVLFTDVSAGAYKDYAGVRLMYNVPAADSPDGVAHSGWCVFVGSHLINAWTYSTPANTAVNVSGGSSDPSLPPEYQEVEYITFDGNEFMLVENLPSNYLLDVLASNSVSMSESCVVGYRDSVNNDTDFEIRFQNGSLNVWARSSNYTFIALGSNPTGYTVNVVRDIVVSCVNHVRGKFFIGKYSTLVDSIPFKGNLYAIKLYSITRIEQALTAIEVIHKFVPCYRKSDGEIGVYEVYTSTFYPNEGTGTLVAGPDVN